MLQVGATGIEEKQLIVFSSHTTPSTLEILNVHNEGKTRKVITFQGSSSEYICI
jgi:hypothetical protein